MAKSLSPDLTLRMASSLSAVPADAWDGCANPPAGERARAARELSPGGTQRASKAMNHCRKFLNQNAKPLNQHLRKTLSQPLHLTCLSLCAGRVRLGHEADRLGRGSCPGGGQRGRIARLRAGLSEEPFAGRICVRPRLGRCLCARRRASITPSSRSPCPSRPRPAGGCSCAPAHGRTKRATRSSTGLKALRDQAGVPRST